MTVIDSVVQHLEEAIISGRYAPNSKLPGEGELSAELEVSRPAVREALAQLRARGYVSTYNGRGTYVEPADIGVVTDNLMQQLRPHIGGGISIDDLFEARRTIEMASIELAAVRATDDDLSRLESYIEQMEAAAPNDPAAYTAADVGFHGAIAQATHNPLYPLLLSPLVDLIVRGMYESVSALRAGMQSGIEDHRRILTCLRARDGVAGLLAVQEHLRASRDKHHQFFNKDGSARVVPRSSDQTSRR